MSYERITSEIGAYKIISDGKRHRVEGPGLPVDGVYDRGLLSCVMYAHTFNDIFEAGTKAGREENRIER